MLRRKSQDTRRELQEEATELLTLMQFLAQIDNAQVTLAVKQQHPKKLEAAVAAILEIESYLNPRARPAGCAVTQVEVNEKPRALVAGV